MKILMLLLQQKHFFSKFIKTYKKFVVFVFSYQVLNRTLLNNPTLGSVQPHLLLALAISWILVIFGVSKGLGSIGWAVTFTATTPYLLVINVK